MAKQGKQLKYKTQEEAENAYAELEAKLGTQGTELASARKQAEQNAQLQQKIAAHETWQSQVAPMLKYVNDNRSAFEQFEQAKRQPAQVQGHQAQAQPAQAGYADTGILTADERGSIATEARQGALQEMNAWVMGTLVPNLEKWTNTQIGNVAKQSKENNDAFQRTFYAGVEGAFPKEVESMKALHTKTLDFADPSKLDPLKMANEYIAREAKITALETERDEGIKQREDDEKLRATMDGSSGISSYSFDPSENGDGPMSEGDKRKAIEQSVVDELGAGSLEVLFR